MPQPPRPITPEQALIRLYRQAAQRLRVDLRHALEADAIGTAVYRKRQLEAIRAQLAALGQRTRRLPVEAVASHYDRGARIADIAVGERTLVTYAFSGGRHIEAARVLADNIAGRLDTVRTVVGRRSDDAFRRAGLEAVGEGLLTGDTRRASSRRLIDQLAQDGMTGFVDARGARWQMDTYAEMVVRTTTREAVSAGTANRMRETGQAIITISSHNTSCDICRAYEGNTYALPGSPVDGYEEIDQLPPFHPNCRHVATPASDNMDHLLRELGVLLTA